MLIGREVTVFSDNTRLKYLHSLRESRNSRLWNWALQLSEMSLNIVHIAGKSNVVADALSRPDKQSVEKVNLITQTDITRGSIKYNCGKNRERILT